VITTVRSVKTETDRRGRATVRAVVAVLRSCAEKTTATQASRAVEVDASDRGGARERGDCGGVVCVARGGSTEATASGEASATAETEIKENTTTTVLGIYRTMKTTSRRHAARHEHTKARAGGRRRAWKPFEARRRRVGGVALLLVEVQNIYRNATGEFL
jgi:hypothetical protein